MRSAKEILFAGMRSFASHMVPARFRVHFALISDEGIGQDQELRQTDSDGDFGMFAGAAQAIVFILEWWVEADGDEGGHVKCLPEHRA